VRILIYGAARSGTTALYAAIHRARPDLIGHFEPRSLAVPAADPRPLLAKALAGAGYPLHRAFMPAFDRRILLTRHPYDRLVSSLLYVPYNGHSFSDDRRANRFLELIRRKRLAPASIPMMALLEDFARPAGLDPIEFFTVPTAGVLAASRSEPVCFPYRYEDFVAGRTEPLSDYLGFPVESEVKVARSLQRVHRRGGAGDWRNWFLPADAEALRPHFADYAAAFGYDLALDRMPEPAIEAAEAELFVLRNLNRYRRRYFLPKLEPGRNRIGEEGVSFDIAVRAIRRPGEEKGARARLWRLVREGRLVAPSLLQLGLSNGLVARLAAPAKGAVRRLLYRRGS